MESAYTEPVSLDGASSTVVDTVNLGLDDPVLRIQGSPRVRVTARIREVQETRAIDTVTVEVRGGSLAAVPARVRVVLAGTAAALARVNPADVEAYVDAARVKNGVAPVAVELAPGQAGVTLKEAVPSQVSLRPPTRRRR